MRNSPATPALRISSVSVGTECRRGLTFLFLLSAIVSLSQVNHLRR